MTARVDRRRTGCRWWTPYEETSMSQDDFYEVLDEVDADATAVVTVQGSRLWGLRRTGDGPATRSTAKRRGDHGRHRL